MARQPLLNLGEQLRNKVQDGLLTGIDGDVLLVADGINLPDLAFDDAMAGFIATHNGEVRNLQHSRSFDVHRWSEHSEANSFIDAIYEELFTGGNANIRKKHLKTVLLDLYLAWREDPALCIAIARDVNAYEPSSRYNSLNISKLTPDILDILIKAGLISQQTGWKDESGRGFRTRIWPRAPLIERFQQLDVPLIAIAHHEEKECIILRDENRKEIEYEDTEDIKTMREQLRAYNLLLTRTFIDMPTLEDAFIEMNSEDPDDPIRLYVNQSSSKKFVKRIFNRSSFDFAGRFYGGWWQNCPSYLRQEIYLDNMPTCEIDFGSLHVAMAYASAEINYFDLGIEDPYALPEFGFFDGEQRKLVKRLMLIALNAKNDEKTFQAFRSNQPTGSPNKSLTNVQLAEVLNALKELHEPISDFIANDAGIRFMRMDSDISNLIVEHFVEQDIPILIMHDSYIVPKKYREDLTHVMKEAYTAVTKAEEVTLKVEELDPDLAYYEPLEEEDGGHKEYEIYMANRDKELDGEYILDDGETSDRYIREYHQFQSYLTSLDEPSD